MINVAVTHIGQSLDLKSGSFSHTIKIELPDGSVVSATVEEGTVEKLLRFVTGGEANHAAEQPTESEDAANAVYNGQPAFVFGGVAEQPTEETVQQQVQPSEVPRGTRIRTVPKDDYGFPIVQPRGVSVDAVLGDDIEDDGVPQI